MATKKTSTDVAVKKPTSGNIVSIQEALKAQAAAVASRVQAPTGASIRVLQDKSFSLPDGTKTPGPLEVVIVDFTSKNVFYESGYDPKNITPPACFAISNGDPDQMVPSKNSPNPQATSCKTCPMNQYGSSGDGKACKNSRVMAVMEPDAKEDSPLWLLATSPTATRNFDNYVGLVARAPFEMPPVGVVTEVGFDPNQTYAKLTFSNPKVNQNIAVHFARQEEAKAMLAAEPDVSGYVSKAKKPAGRR